MDALEARENMKVTGWDGVDDDVPPEPRPTRRDVVKATSIINKYLIELDDHQFRRLEAMLSAFNWQLRLDETRNLKETSLTDFFTHT